MTRKDPSLWVLDASWSLTCAELMTVPMMRPNMEQGHTMNDIQALTLTAFLFLVTAGFMFLCDLLKPESPAPPRTETMP